MEHTLKIFVTFTIVATLVSCKPSQKDTISRIVNAVPAAKITENSIGKLMKNKGEYPYMASLQRVKDHLHICGAVIIKDNAVITAAHCTENMDENDLCVMAGSFNLLDRESKNVQTRSVKKYLNHHSHRKDHRFDNDIAIIWVEPKFMLGLLVNTISLAGQDHWHEQAFILGWGENEKGKMPDYLMRANFETLTRNECKRAYQYTDYKITSSMVCAHHYINKQGICTGDSGGPLIVRTGKKRKTDLLVGLSSWGFTYFINDHIDGRAVMVKKCSPIYPSVFADISALRPWILSNMDKYDKKPCKKRIS